MLGRWGREDLRAVLDAFVMATDCLHERSAPLLPVAPKLSSMNNPHKERTGIDRMIRAAQHSFHGLVSAYRRESAFRQELWAAALLLPLALWVGRVWVETVVLIGSVILVLVVELINSSIEAAIDRVSIELHELSKHAKDVASAAVLMSLLLCGGVWLTALWLRLAT